MKENDLDHYSDYYRSCSVDQLYVAINSADVNILNACLENPLLNEMHVIAMLRNPFISQEIVRKICSNHTLISKYQVKAAVIHCPKTPYNLSSEYINYLFWRDLVAVAKDNRIDPRLRVAAERLIIEKMEELSIGEKIALSRIATQQLIKVLIKERDVKVLKELLINPFIVEDDVIRMITTAKNASILVEIANSQKWRFRYNIRKALVNNTLTPLGVSLNILPSLLKSDLLAIVKQYTLNPMLRREAEQVLNQRGVKEW